MTPIPPGIPQTLRDLLAILREVQRQRDESGFRLTATNVREALDALTRRYVTEVPAIALVRDELIQGSDFAVPVRLYHPAPAAALPVAVFVHGGGHIAGSVSLYDPIVRKLALASRRLVVSVEYRLDP